MHPLQAQLQPSRGPPQHQGPSEDPLGPQGPPKDPLGPSKTLQGPPEDPLGPSKRPQKPPDDPLGLSEGPKGPSGGPQAPQGLSEGSQGPPVDAQGPPEASELKGPLREGGASQGPQQQHIKLLQRIERVSDLNKGSRGPPDACEDNEELLPEGRAGCC